MTPTRLRECLDTMHWSQRVLAAETGYHEPQVRRWLAGARIPDHVAEWLERVTRAVVKCGKVVAP